MLPVMNPKVCMGPPKPSMKPPPHGIRHCQKYVPARRGVMKLKVMVSCGPEVHGDVPHRVAVSDGEPMGTLRPTAGIENVCPTLQPVQELSTVNGLPFSNATLPMVPVTPLHRLLRSGVQPS